MDQAGVVVLTRPGGLLDDATLLVGDGGEASSVLIDDVEIAQDKDDGHRQDSKHHQGDADHDAPWREV